MGDVSSSGLNGRFRDAHKLRPRCAGASYFSLRLIEDCILACIEHHFITHTKTESVNQITTQMSAEEKTSESEIIRLNIGGTFFTTTKFTLMSSEYFESRLSGRMNPGYIEGALFVDRSGKLFIHVLEYMRNLENWCPPIDSKLLLDLVVEAQFYGIDGMISVIQANTTPSILPFWLMCYKDEKTSAYSHVCVCGQAPKSVVDIVSTWSIKSTELENGRQWYMYAPPGQLGVVGYYQNQFRDKFIISQIEEHTKYTIVCFVDKHADDPVYALLRSKLGVK